MNWLVAVCCLKSDPLSNPADFLANPGNRIQPGWVCYVVEAANKHEAYEKGFDAWDEGHLPGQEPGDWLVNWCVAPLPARADGTALAEPKSADSVGTLRIVETVSGDVRLLIEDAGRCLPRLADGMPLRDHRRPHPARTASERRLRARRASSAKPEAADARGDGVTARAERRSIYANSTCPPDHFVIKLRR